MKSYMSVDQAKRAAAKRSLFANQNGECSQYVVIRGKIFGIRAGLASDCMKFLAEQGNGEIVAQYSAGYSCN